jgi:DNA-binding NtrC family response regulator
MNMTRHEQENDSSQESTERSTSNATVGRRVLVVEDETRLRDMLNRAIRDMGFEIQCVGSAEAAMRVFESRPVDIAIVDLNLPGMGGMEFIEAMHRRWPDTQPVVMTGFGNLQSAKRAMRVDVVDFLTKPCALGDLEIALDRARQRRMAKLPALPTLPDPPEEPQRPAYQPPPPPPGYEPVSLEEMERRHILATLEKNGGNRTLTAQELGISLRKLYYRLGQYQREGMLPERESNNK